MNVYFTFDVEVWCEGWNALEEKFPSNYKKYIEGRTSKGSYGLDYLLSILKEHDLKGVFFTEPLFSARFGVQYLENIIKLISEYEQEIQLHIHTEWLDELKESSLAKVDSKVQHLNQLSLVNQIETIKYGKSLLEKAGCKNEIMAFRAGSFALNADTLLALPYAGIRVDASYNRTTIIDCDQKNILCNPKQSSRVGTIMEYPMSYFKDGFGRMRHAQIGACSSSELINAMRCARKVGWKDFVLLIHNFELLDNSKTKLDPVVERRYRKVCEFLSENKEDYPTSWFIESDTNDASDVHYADVSVGYVPTLRRFMEQSVRRILY